MITQEYILIAPEGIHARPAAALVKLARAYKAVVQLQKGDKVVQLNSLLNILSLGAKGGDKIILSITGEEEAAAAAALELFFSSLKA